MSEQMIIWCAIVGVLVCAFAFRSFAGNHVHVRKVAVRHHNNRHHIIEIGKEKEMFYLPGDRNDDDDEF